MYIIVVYICMDKVIWETLINRGNDTGWLDQVNKIVLECETSLIDNLGLPVIGKLCQYFFINFGEILSIHLFIKLVNLPDNNWEFYIQSHNVATKISNKFFLGQKKSLR
jgi:hypothetical protein